MPNAILLIVGAAFLLTVVFFLVLAIKGSLKYRGPMLVTCPETKQPAGVKVDRKFTAVNYMVGEQRLRLNQCTRWPERQECGQACLSQLEDTPEACKVRNILGSWYQDKACVYCAKPFGAVHWHDHKPALRSPAGELVEWQEIAIETLPQVLEVHQPVCWDCLIAESFRRRYPELVT
ncbi:MAG: hypothetical protein ACE5IY_05145, partial [bacterium]